MSENSGTPPGCSEFSDGFRGSARCFDPRLIYGNPTLDLGIRITFCEAALIENNLIDLELANGVPVDNPMRDTYCQSVRYFNNTDAAGQLIQGAVADFDLTSISAIESELSSLVDEALTLAFL